MANQRFSKIFSLSKNLYSLSSPIIVQAGAMLYDNASKKTLCQLKIKSISEKEISGIKIFLILKNASGKVININIPFEYSNLRLLRNQTVGEQTPIFISNDNAREFAVRVSMVEFADGTVWENEIKGLSSLPDAIPVSDWLNSPYQISEYKRRYSEQANFAFFKCKDLWFCPCGNINNEQEEQCFECGLNLSDISQTSKQELHNDGIYNEALKCMDSTDIKNIKAARKGFASILNWRDAKEKLQECDDKIAEFSNFNLIDNIVIEAPIMLDDDIKPSAEEEEAKRLAEEEAARIAAEKDGEEAENRKEDSNSEESVLADEVAPEQSKKMPKKKLMIIVGAALASLVILTAIILACVFLFFGDGRYDEINREIEQGNYAQAYLLTENLEEGVEGKEEKIEEIRALAAAEADRLAAEYKFAEAYDLLDEVGFSSFTYEKKGIYSMFANGEYSTAISRYGATEIVVLPEYAYRVNSANLMGATSVIFVDGITEIYDFALYDCISLREVTIPKSVTRIGHKAFAGCDLSAIYYGGTSSDWDAVSKDVDWWNPGWENYCTIYVSSN